MLTSRWRPCLTSSLPAADACPTPSFLAKYDMAALNAPIIDSRNQAIARQVEASAQQGAPLTFNWSPAAFDREGQKGSVVRPYVRHALRDVSVDVGYPRVR
jgi:hypothetical protein